MALVLQAAVVLVQEDSHILCGCAGHPVNDSLPGLVLAYKALCACSGIVGNVRFLVKAQNGSVCLADVIVVFHAVRGDEFHLENHEAVIPVRLHAGVDQLLSGDACVL